MVTLANIDWQPLLDGGDGPPLLVLLASGIVIIAVVAIMQWRRVRIAEAEVNVELRMIEWATRLSKSARSYTARPPSPTHAVRANAASFT